MKRRLHLIALVLFLSSLAYDLVVWGAAPSLPGVGMAIVDSARRETFLANTYITVGAIPDRLSVLREFGARRLTDALGEGFDRIREDPVVAMDVFFRASLSMEQRWLRWLYWMPPVLFFLTLLTWARRPRQVRALERR